MLRVGTDRATIEAHLGSLAQVAADQLRMLRDACAPRATARVIIGDPTKCLVRETRNAKVDLVVLGPGRAAYCTARLSAA